MTLLAGPFCHSINIIVFDCRTFIFSLQQVVSNHIKKIVVKIKFILLEVSDKSWI